MEGRTYHTITSEDVGKATLDLFGKTYRVGEFMGRVREFDIGKRIYQDWATGILSVENDAQRAQRIGMERGYAGRP